MSILVKIKPFTGYTALVNDYYANHSTFHAGDAGIDLFCVEHITVPPRAISVKVPLGICVEALNFDSFHQSMSSSLYLYPRSSTGLKTPIRLSNSVGIIDAGYRGHLMAIVDNVSDEPFLLKKGERYFQLCGPALQSLNIELATELSNTSRGTNGFGSTN